MCPMTTLQAQWTELLSLEPEDWSFLSLELVLDDAERMEEAALLACPLNPWHGASWRSGAMRFRVARTDGYGADPGVTRSVLGRLDAGGIGGRLRVLSALDGVRLVLSQGPT
jgi:hypothetical protein